MNHALKPEENTFVLVYLDDVLIFSSNFDDHLQHLDKVISLLNQHQLSLRLSKCKIGKSELNYLGHILSSQGIKPSSKKIEAVKHLQFLKMLLKFNNFLDFVISIVVIYSTVLILHILYMNLLRNMYLSNGLILKIQLFRKWKRK